MRLVDNYPASADYQLISIKKLPIKLQMTLCADVDEETRNALKAHLLNLSFSLAAYQNVIIHIPKKGYTLSYNINPNGYENAEYIIDDVRDIPAPASIWSY